MIAVAYGVRQNSSIVFGERGFAYGSRGFIAWPVLAAFTWDRDIGQQQWGYTATVPRGRSSERLRQFVVREHRAEIDAMLVRYAPAAAATSLSSTSVST